MRLTSYLAGIFFAVLVVVAAFYLLKMPSDQAFREINNSFGCPIFRCDSARTGLFDTGPSGITVATTRFSMGTNLQEGQSDKLSEEFSFDSSPLFIDLDGDLNKELVAYSWNLLYNKSSNQTYIGSSVMCVKSGNCPSGIRKQSFGEGYYRDWYFEVPSEVHTSFSAGDLDFDLSPEVAFGSDGGKLYVLRSNGTLAFEFDARDKIQSTPAIADINSDGKFEILFGSDDGSFYCIDNVGRLLWKYDSGSAIKSSPAIFSYLSKNYAAVGSQAGLLHVLDGQGRQICSFGTKGSIWSSPVFHEGKIIFGSDDGRVYMISPECKLIWNFSTEGKVRSSLAVFGNYFVAGSEDGKLYFFNESENFSFFSGSPIWSSPMVAAGRVYAALENGTVFSANESGAYILKEITYANKFSCSMAYDGSERFSCNSFAYHPLEGRRAFFFIHLLNAPDIGKISRS